ncbi:MAG TPA: tetratricopeptide repeat protein [Terriglobia bacterium]|jgi:tetratricopeptide (TPR) repeat protein
MAKILIAEKHSAERDALALVMDFAGHQCTSAGSLQEAENALQKEGFDLVLADAALGANDPEQIVKRLKAASPRVAVMVVSDEVVAPGAEEVVTLARSPAENLSQRFSTISRGEEFVLLLPQQEALRRLSGLPQTPGMLNKLAVLYHSQKKFEAAERLYKKALKLIDKESGAHRGEEATILNNLGRLYHDENRGAEAEAMYKRSLAIVEKVFGASHAKVARRLRNLADLYRSKDRDAEAEALLKRAKAIG